jgi:predicted transcriptional regulator
MGNLSEFQRGQIVGARLAGASVIKSATLLGASRAAVSKFTMEYTTHGNTSATKRNSGRKSKPSERDRRTLKRILSNNYSTAAKETAELIIHLEDPVSTTVRRKLHKSNIQGTATIAKPLVNENNARRPKRCSDNHKTWTDDWKNVIWSNESSFTLFPTSGRVYVWRTPKEAYNSNCETWRRICDDLGSNILVYCWFYTYNYYEGLNSRQ